MRRLHGSHTGKPNDCEDHDMTTYTYTIKQDGDHVTVAILHGPRGLSPAAARQRLMTRLDRGASELLEPVSRETLRHADVHRVGGAV